MNASFTTIESLGRQALINKIAGNFSSITENIIRGIGDDAAVHRIDDNHAVVISSDTLVEGVDFDLTYTPFHHLGFKCVTAAVSDIYAMNAKPEGLLVNLGIPNKISVEMLDEFFKGIKAGCQEYGVDLAGGDVTASPGTLVVAVTAYGKNEIDRIVYRSGASVGDALCVTGDLGAAYAGVSVLRREKKFWEDQGGENAQPDLSDYEYVVRRQLVPVSRKDVIEAFENHGIRPTSLIDLSKNFLTELVHITSASKCGAYLYQAALPIALETRAVADEFEEDADRFALQGGEDFELLFTLPEAAVNTFSDKFKDFVVIGKITAQNDGVKMQSGTGDVVTLDTSDMKQE